MTNPTTPTVRIPMPSMQNLDHFTKVAKSLSLGGKTKMSSSSKSAIVALNSDRFSSGVSVWFLMCCIMMLSETEKLYFTPTAKKVI